MSSLFSGESDQVGQNRFLKYFLKSYHGWMEKMVWYLEQQTEYSAGSQETSVLFRFHYELIIWP